MNVYRTSEIADIIGIHPNTVRLYESLGFIPRPRRQANGYRIFTEFHVEQLRLARLAFQIEVLQNGLRKKMVEAVKASASGKFDIAMELTQEYISQIEYERANAEEAIIISRQILSSQEQEDTKVYKRKEVSELLNVSVDALRNWEMNGLLTVKRKQNGYRIYTEEEIKRLKIIRSLRCANYSLEAILRMLSHLPYNPSGGMREILDTPESDTDVVAVCDRLLTSLSNAEKNAQEILNKLGNMKIKFPNPPL